MIVKEDITINGTQFVRTYSDEGRYVVRDNISYEEAIDPKGLNREYTEGEIITYTDDNIPDDEELSDAQLIAVLTGEAL